MLHQGSSLVHFPCICPIAVVQMKTYLSFEKGLVFQLDRLFLFIQDGFVSSLVEMDSQEEV